MNLYLCADRYGKKLYRSHLKGITVHIRIDATILQLYVYVSNVKNNAIFYADTFLQWLMFFYKKMGLSRPLFVYLRPFLHETIQI